MHDNNEARVQDAEALAKSCSAEGVCACGADCNCGDDCRCTPEANCTSH